MINTKNSRYYGEFGGRFVPEILVPPLDRLEKDFKRIVESEKFKGEYEKLLQTYVGRPTPLYYSKKLSRVCGCDIYLKREDLCHTGAHKINNALGQALVAKYMGKKEIIAETGAGQHGVAVATAAALIDKECKVYMGEKDIKRQQRNVQKMKLLGTDIIPVKEGSKTLKAAVNAALRAWTKEPRKLYYLIGSCVGPHPYPLIVRFFQSVIGREVKRQLSSPPDYLIACVGGGSNALGLFYPYFRKKEVKLVGVEASKAATLSDGKVGVLHGAKSYLLFNKNGQISETESVAPGLDYSGVGPQHSYFKQIRRAEYRKVADKEVLKAFAWLSREEGIIPALESAHAVAWAMYHQKFKPDQTAVINISGRGDKDMDEALKRMK